MLFPSLGDLEYTLRLLGENWTQGSIRVCGVLGSLQMDWSPNMDHMSQDELDREVSWI